MVLNSFFPLEVFLNAVELIISSASSLKVLLKEFGKSCFFFFFLSFFLLCLLLYLPGCKAEIGVLVDLLCSQR